MSREPCFWFLHVSRPQLTPNRVYLEPHQHPDGRALPGLSKDWPLLCCPGFTLYLLPGTVNESAYSVGYSRTYKHVAEKLDTKNPSVDKT
ncbi:hypothetical protein E2C01_048178 [Portunus trituberculatus]|uniref:Uncharacterized protein n=1 Tax=Portunus trituberculatus TaxID=210409 RepID=A0A5B7GAU7_PORTR|nr:hypothetical protein [Portunus trituberculatus]